MATGRKSICEEDNQKKEEEEEENKSLIKPRKYLNDDILFNILTRIPADILHKNFKYQCRQWRSLVSDKYFINANFCQSKPGIIYIEEVRRGSKRRYLLKYMEFSGSEILQVRKLQVFETLFEIKSSCNGLLLIQLYPKGYRIINTVTRKHTTFPAMGSNFWCELVFHGEYKVVELLFHHESICLRITTLNGNPPEYIQVPENYHGEYRWSHVYINGVFYWIYDYHIVSFDLDTEAFHVLQTPDTRGCYSVKLINLFGSLSLVAYGIIHVWCMEGEEWKRVFTLNDYADFVGFLGDANLFIYTDIHDKLRAYDVKKKEYRLLDDGKYPKNVSECFGYKVHVSSFLSLKYKESFSCL